jgi:choline kinase
MNSIIIADKYAKGMKSKGCYGLIQINQRTNLFQTQYKAIKTAFPRSNIIYVYGFENKKIKRYFSKNYQDVIAIENKEYNETGFVNSIKCASDYLDQNCLIFFGDLAIKSEMFKNFNREKSHIYLSKKNNNSLGCIVRNNNVLNISYGLDNYLLNMYYINKKNIETFSYYINENKLRNYFLFEIINKMIDQGITFHPSIQKNKKIISINKKPGV